MPVLRPLKDDLLFLFQQGVYLRKKVDWQVQLLSEGGEADDGICFGVRPSLWRLPFFPNFSDSGFPEVVEATAGFLYALADLLQFPVDIFRRFFDEVGEILRIGDLVLASRANCLKFIGERDVK